VLADTRNTPSFKLLFYSFSIKVHAVPYSTRAFPIYIGSQRAAHVT